MSTGRVTTISQTYLWETFGKEADRRTEEGADQSVTSKYWVDAIETTRKETRLPFTLPDLYPIKEQKKAEIFQFQIGSYCLLFLE